MVGPNGTIYAASNGGVLHAINPSTGADRWTYDCGHTDPGSDLSVSSLVLADGAQSGALAGSPKASFEVLEAAPARKL